MSAEVSSTTTKSIPNGIIPGEVVVVSQSTAASIPVGNINFTGLTLANVAATDLQAAPTTVLQPFLQGVLALDSLQVGLLATPPLERLLAECLR